MSRELEILPPLPGDHRIRLVYTNKPDPEPEPLPTFVCVVCQQTVQPKPWSSDKPPICWECCGRYAVQGGQISRVEPHMPFSEHEIAIRFSGMVGAIGRVTGEMNPVKWTRLHERF